MNFKQTLFTLAVGTMSVTCAMSAHAANTFSFIGSSVEADWGSLPSGSWYSLGGYYVPMRAPGSTDIPGPNGTLNFDVENTLTHGYALEYGSYSHNSGNMIDRDAKFFDGWLAHLTTGALEIAWDGASNTATVNMGNWRLAYYGSTTSFGAGTSALLNNQDGIWGNGNDTLDFTAIGIGGYFPGTEYKLHLVGYASLTPVPEASTYGMMLAGLGLVGFAVRRRK